MALLGQCVSLWVTGMQPTTGRNPILFIRRVGSLASRLRPTISRLKPTLGQRRFSNVYNLMRNVSARSAAFAADRRRSSSDPKNCSPLSLSSSNFDQLENSSIVNNARRGAYFLKSSRHARAASFVEFADESRRLASLQARRQERAASPDAKFSAPPRFVPQASPGMGSRN